MEQCKRRNCKNVLHFPKDLVRAVLPKLPVESVARFRCVSTTWLSVSTDPWFIAEHARHAPRYWIVRSVSRLENPAVPVRNRLFSFPFGNTGRNMDHMPSHKPRCSCDGLVLFFRGERGLPTAHYVMNLLTGLRVDLPNPSIRSKIMSKLALYYHRRTAEYRLVNLRECEGSVCHHLDAEVLSLAGACSWRLVEAKAPPVYLTYLQSRVLVNDRLYWACCGRISQDHTILVFDILQETFSLMDLPCYGGETFTSFASAYPCLNHGLIEMEGSLCWWVVYRDLEDVKIDVWPAVDGDRGWMNAYSLSFVKEDRWAFCYPDKEQRVFDTCICISGKKLLFLFDNVEDTIFVIRWDLDSGISSTEMLLVEDDQLMCPAYAYRETLVNVCCDAVAQRQV